MNTLRVFARKDFLIMNARGLGTNGFDARAAGRACIELAPQSICFGPESVKIVYDGETDPKAVAEAARNWNKELEDLAVSLAAKWLENPTFGTPESRDLVHALMQSLAQANADMEYGMTHAVIREYGTFGTFHPRMDDGTIGLAQDHPEMFVVFDIAYDESATL